MKKLLFLCVLSACSMQINAAATQTSDAKRELRKAKLVTTIDSSSALTPDDKETLKKLAQTTAPAKVDDILGAFELINKTAAGNPTCKENVLNARSKNDFNQAVSTCLHDFNSYRDYIIAKLYALQLGTNATSFNTLAEIEKLIDSL